ncbi:unnamed protein product [Polarella glacialis]|uniref:Uncharacterized protein n=1 Tax=Polarella glacialis TaxID=89957 RepID=A0A813IRJ8_POLGL|nr:unnamed protein product [Polarella glacialis]
MVDARGCPWDRMAFAWAAHTGAMEALQYLHVQGAPLDPLAASFAAESGRLDVLRWLHARDAPIDKDRLYNHAASAGHKEVLQWARENCGPHFTLDAGTCAQVAQSEDEAKARSILEWLRQEGFPWGEETAHNAMRKGHIELVRWLILEGAPFDHGMLTQLAASYGDREVLEWLTQRNVQVGPQTWFGATSRSNHNICEWLLEKEVPWDTEACEGAAMNDDLDMLKWLRERGAPWDEQVTHEAIDHSGGEREEDDEGPAPNIELLAWSRAHGCPIDPDWSLRLLDWLLLHDWIEEPEAIEL